MFLDVQQVVAQFIFDASGMGAPLTGMDWTSTRPHRSTDGGPRANHHVPADQWPRSLQRAYCSL